MDIEQVLHGSLEPLQVHTGIQVDEGGQVGGGIAPHDVGKVNLQVGEGVHRTYGVVHLLLLLLFLIVGFQLYHAGMGHQVVQGDGEIHLLGQVGEQQHAAHGIHARPVKVGVDAEVLVAQYPATLL